MFAGISVGLAAGERVGLSGESGCGKTSLLRAVAGLLPASARTMGTIRVEGGVGYIPQESLHSLSPFLTAGEQLADLTTGEEAFSLLERAGLAGQRFHDAYPHQLSGGERQRILVLQALAPRPALILADEPTAHLDADSEGLVLDLLDTYAKESGAAVLIASHREHVFERLQCKVVRMTPASVAAPVQASQQEGGRPLVSIRSLSKTYTRRDWLTRTRPVVRALDGVSFEICAGDVVAILGPSGAGKSTIARCLAGREQVDSGSIDWPGSSAELPDRTQLVEQEPSGTLNPTCSVGGVIQEGVDTGTPALLSRIGLPAAWWRRNVSELSEGQRARVAILRTAERLAHGPGVLILDESLSGLDSTTRSSILTYLLQLRAERGLSLLLITHDMEVAQEAGARVLHLKGGRLAA